MLQVVTWVREGIGRHWTAEDLATSSIRALVKRAGIDLVKGTQVASAILCEPVVAQRLDIMVGAPLLRVERRLLDAGDQPHVFVEILARPDRFKLQMEFGSDEV